uniref:Uncharacterized protein n=1 Tax=Anopheles maculatus TaxID=74869 RepID=A0A182T2N7_9DIPT
PEDKVDIVESIATKEAGPIPGLDLNLNSFNEKMREKKIPYSKPIPRNFQAQWNESSKLDDHATTADEIKEVISQIVDNGPAAPKKPLPTAISLYERTVAVIPDSPLEQAISEGTEALNRFIEHGGIPELHDIFPPIAEPDPSANGGNDGEQPPKPPAKRARVDVEPKFFYGPLPFIVDPPEQSRDSIHSAQEDVAAGSRSKDDPTFDPKLPSLLQLDVNPPIPVEFNTSDPVDIGANRNSWKGREREKHREKRDLEEDKKIWKEYNDRNWDEEDNDDSVMIVEPPSSSSAMRSDTPLSQNTNSNGQWMPEYDNDLPPGPPPGMHGMAPWQMPNNGNAGGAGMPPFGGFGDDDGGRSMDAFNLQRPPPPIPGGPPPPFGNLNPNPFAMMSGGPNEDDGGFPNNNHNAGGNHRNEFNRNDDWMRNDGGGGNHRGGNHRNRGGGGRDFRDDRGGGGRRDRGFGRRRN